MVRQELRVARDRIGPKLDQGTGDLTVQLGPLIAEKGADGRVSIYGVSPCLGNEGVVGVLRSFGANVYSDDGTKALIGSEEAIAGLQWIADQFVKNKVALPLDAGAKQTDVLTVFPTGNLMCFVSTSSQPGNLHRMVAADKFKWMILPPPTVKPTDKFPTQISSDGYGMSKATKYPDQAWEVVKLYASKDHGLNRNLAGLGSPGSRYDVWTDEAFKKNAPELGLIYDTLLNPDKAAPALPWNNPANGRYFEADTLMNNALADVWLGNKSAKDVAPDLQKQMQAIMDKAPV